MLKKNYERAFNNRRKAIKRIWIFHTCGHGTFNKLKHTFKNNIVFFFAGNLKTFFNYMFNSYVCLPNVKADDHQNTLRLVKFLI